MWDVGNFLLDPPSEQNNTEHQEDEQESNKEETKKEPKVSLFSSFSSFFLTISVKVTTVDVFHYEENLFCHSYLFVNNPPLKSFEEATSRGFRRFLVLTVLKLV